MNTPNALQHGLRPPKPIGSGPEVEAARLNLYRSLVRPGELAFDIGANCGEMTAGLLSLGCRVVAVEPNQVVAEMIDPRATVVQAACGAQPGRLTMQIAANAYLSTAREFVRDHVLATTTANSYSPLEVDVVTLDGLIERFGVPTFVKIDTEGFEAEVIRGLTRPVRVVCFEDWPWERGKTGECMAMLDALGDYGYTFSVGESYELEPWPPQRTDYMFGDVWAVLREQVDSKQHSEAGAASSMAAPAT